MTDMALLADMERHWGIRSRFSVVDMPETGASMIRWCHANENGEFHFRPVQHNRYVLSLILKPMEATAWAGRRKMWDGPIGRHGVRIVHPDDENSWHSTGSFDLLHILFPRTTVGRMFDADHDEASHPVRFRDPLYSCDETVLQITRQMVDLLGQEGPFVKDIADGLCHALIAYLMRRYALGVTHARGMPPGRLQMRRVLELIGDNLSRDVTLEEMAQEARMSIFHFSREFRKCTGKSPHQYLMARRVERAKELLANERLSILDISLECGFKDASHFSRVFRSIAGDAPRSYRAFM